MMEKIFISVEKSSRMVSSTKKYIGNDLENLQQEIVFKFTDEFVNGSARLEYQLNNNKYHIPMTKDGETYTVPIKNVLTKEGRIPMQLVIVQVAQGEEIPVFKSDVFDMWCNKSINAQEEAPDDYEYWLDIIEEKLAEMDEALEQVDRLDIDASKTGSVATVSITNKEGVTKTVEITDGVDGAPGQDGEPGPANTLTIGTVTKGEEADASITGDAPNQTLNLVLPKGDKGDKGDTGNTGPSGNDGFSPLATVTKTGTTATITITDKNGTTTASISDGEEYDDTEIRGLITEKQDELVSGINIKTINNQSVLGEGNIKIDGVNNYQELTNKPSINSVTLSGNKTSSDLGLQDTLVSNTNIKTINNQSLLGSGNIDVASDDNYIFDSDSHTWYSYMGLNSLEGVNYTEAETQHSIIDLTYYLLIGRPITIENNYILYSQEIANVTIPENNYIDSEKSVALIIDMYSPYDNAYLGSVSYMIVENENSDGYIIDEAFVYSSKNKFEYSIYPDRDNIEDSEYRKLFNINDKQSTSARVTSLSSSSTDTQYPSAKCVYDELQLKQNVTDNALNTTNKTIPTAINEVNSIAKGANQALSYSNYQAMTTEFNVLNDDIYNVGQNVMIITLEVPDLWVSGIESTSSTYTYTTDASIVNELQTNGYIQVGYYKLSMLETQKVDLTNYALKSEIPTVPTNVSAFTNDAGYLTSHQDISGKEDKTNKVTSISSSSTNTQYPSALAVYNYIQSLDASEVSY